MTKREIEEINQLPEKYRPIGAWSYFWLTILFNIPVVGFVFLIVFSFSGGNVSRRSFARSYFCFLIIVLIVLGIVIATGGLAAIAGNITNSGK